MGRLSKKNVNPYLIKERSRASFDVEKLTNILDGDEKSTIRRRYIESELLKEKEIADEPDSRFMSRDQSYTNAIKKASLLIRKIRDPRTLGVEDVKILARNIYPNEAFPYTLSPSMASRMVELQGTEEQVARWVERMKNFEIQCTYAQTELGHGTQVRNLETTATYDPSREEFVLDSPTLTSAKFWPGGLGKSTNHAIVMARLITGGRDHGIHPFVVQLRDMKTHEPLPGVTVGDIGPKLGYETMDNGYLRFHGCRIPRENMLMKFNEVRKDGTYVRKGGHDKLMYGSMLDVRVNIVLSPAALGLAESVTIAIRYSCARHQSEITPGEPEPPVLDFLTQQRKLFPALAQAYAYTMVGNNRLRDYRRIFSDLQEGKVDELAELHANASCLKAVTSSGAARGMELCRLACGGHGYSDASNFRKIYSYTVSACTYEGENTVLLLQTARYLMKMYQQAKSGGRVTGFSDYLAGNFGRKWERGSVKGEGLLELLKYNAFRAVQEASERLTRLQAGGMSAKDAWNDSGVLLVKAAEAHCQQLIAGIFLSEITGVKDLAVREVLLNLYDLYAGNELLENSGHLLADGYITPAQLDSIERLWFDTLKLIRPEAVALVDAFDFTDRQLGSVLGRYDGNVYENLIDWAERSPLNATQVHDSFKHIRSLQQAKL